MKTDNGESVSPWMAAPDVRVDGKLSSDLEADVCVVGAGIAGLTTAYLLARERQAVVVLDDGPVGGGETGRTTAHLVNAPRRPLHRDRAAARRARAPALAAESHTRRHRPDRGRSSADEQHRLRLRAARRLPVPAARRIAGASRAGARGAHRGRPDGRRAASTASPIDSLRHRALPALPAPGAVPPAEVPRGLVRGDPHERAAGSTARTHADEIEGGDASARVHGEPARRSPPTPSSSPPTRRSTTASRSTPSRRRTAPT